MSLNLTPGQPVIVVSDDLENGREPVSGVFLGLSRRGAGLNRIKLLDSAGGVFVATDGEITPL